MRHAPPHRVGLVLVELGLLIALLVYIGALLSLQSSFCPESMPASLSLINSVCMPEKEVWCTPIFLCKHTLLFCAILFSFCVCACQIVFMIESVLFIYHISLFLVFFSSFRKLSSWVLFLLWGCCCRRGSPHPHECTYFVRRPKSSSASGEIPSFFIQSSHWQRCPRLRPPGTFCLAWEREAWNGTKFCPSLMQPDLAEEQGHPTNTAPVNKYSAGGVVRFFWGNQNVQIKMRVASAAAPVYIHTHTQCWKASG